MTFGYEAGEKPVHGCARGVPEGCNCAAMLQQLVAVYPQYMINPTDTQALTTQDMLRLHVLAHSHTLLHGSHHPGFLHQLLFDSRGRPGGNPEGKARVLGGTHGGQLPHFCQAPFGCVYLQLGPANKINNFGLLAVSLTARDLVGGVEASQKRQY